MFEEKQSGAQRTGRITLAELIAYARQGDTVVVSSMDRLARSVVDLNKIVAELIEKDVAVKFITEKATFRAGNGDPFAEFQLNIMASFAQLERSISKERQAEGIRAGKARGVYRGRTPAMKPPPLAAAPELIDTVAPRRGPRQYGVNRSSLNRAHFRDALIQRLVQGRFVCEVKPAHKRYITFVCLL